MTTLIITVLLSLGVINSPEEWYQLTTSQQSELQEIIIEDLEMS